jgi:hypothetical protein
MPEQTKPTTPTTPPIQSSLHELAEVLRHGQHLGPETQNALANLMDELGKQLDPAAIPSNATTQLVASTAQLVKGLQQKHSPTLLAAAKDRLQAAALRAENEVPLATGLVQRLLETLADFGI